MSGVRIIESLLMVDTVEDWTNVRSPSRAERRRRYGHRQNIVVRNVPKKEAISLDGGRTLTMHPEMARLFRELIKKQEPLGQTFSDVLHANRRNLYGR